MHGNHFFLCVLGTRKCKHGGNKPGGHWIYWITVCQRVVHTKHMCNSATVIAWQRDPVYTDMNLCISSRQCDRSSVCICVCLFCSFLFSLPNKPGLDNDDWTHPGFSYRSPFSSTVQSWPSSLSSSCQSSPLIGHPGLFAYDLLCFSCTANNKTPQ